MEVEEQDYSDTGGSGVMVSNLPLLFSRGSPSSLCDMAQSELEVFVPFMVRCSVGEERPVPWSHLPRPPWWPKKLPFRMPSTRSALMGLVERCYSFHGCDYLLQFCASLVAQMPPAGYRFNDNRDGTTSMYHGNTGKLLVTFRNENRDYDKYRHGGKGRDATKKLLLSPTSGGGGGGGGGGSSTAMIQPPVTDIYLCDKCENEFYSLKEVQAHERHCCGEVPSSPSTPSPEPEVAEEEPEPTGQVPFLSYFNLRPAQHTGLKPHMSPRKKSVSSPPAKLPGPIYPRYDTIALTSPLGRYLFAHSKFRNKYQASQHSVMRYERHLHATPNADINYRERCTSRWIVVWRSRKEQPPWVHLYCFNRAQRTERTITIRTGLSRDSRRLLRLCRPSAVKVKRLPKRTVDRLLRIGGATSAPCIDLTDEQQQLEVGHVVPWAQDPRFAYWVSPKTPSAPGNLELQWVTGLPDQSSVCLPGGSGTLPPHYTSLGLRNMVGLSVGHHSSLNFLPLGPGSTRQQQLPPGLTLQPSPLSSHPLLPLLSNNSHPKASQNPPVQDGLGRLHFPLTADVSISPIGGPALPTRSQLEADFMKPLSKKKFTSLLGSSISKANKQTGRTATAIAFPGSQPLHLVPPQPPDWEKAAPPAGGEGNTLPHTHTSSSIEVIDLSSDEDDYGRGSGGRGRSKAANAPQQLEGLACYPHTGAKVPSESSEYSLSKNGNSHWSSQQKSHCGAGRVGDLATNGQPPKVLPSPVTHTPSPTPGPQGTQAKGNGRKRKIEEDSAPPRGSKTIILDISNQGVVVSEGQRPLAPSTSTSASSDPGFPHTQYWRNNEEGVVGVSSLPHHSVTLTQTNLTSDTANSFHMDQDITLRPEWGWEAAPAVPQQDVGSGVKFLSRLFNKGVELFKSLVGKESEIAATSPRGPAGSEYHQGAVQPSPPLAKRSSQLQMLLKDECHELQRGGMRELTRLDLQGVRLTRQAAGHILPSHPSRKNLGLRLGENRPPNRNGSKARREDGRGSRKEAVGRAPGGVKGPAPLCVDENGNSASCVQAAIKRPDARECLGLASRSQNGPSVVAESPRVWPVAASTLEKSDGKLSSSGNVVGKSRVFSEISIRNCGLENSCSDVWVKNNSVTHNLQHTQCTTAALNTKVTHTEMEEKRKGLCGGGASATRRVHSFTLGEEQHVCGPKGKAALGRKVTRALPWGTTNTTTSIKTNLPGMDSNISSLNLTRLELTGETAEECGAQLALCPLPDQLQHHPAGSGTPPTSQDQPHLTLLNSIRNSPVGKQPPNPWQEPQPYLSPPTKPHSTNRRKKTKLHRELISLGRDEYKEIQGTGFHPSDYLGREEVKYLSVSSDEDETPSHSLSLTPPQPARDGELLLSAKVSREVARLLGDECKELQDRECKSDWDRNDKWRSMHPLAQLVHSTGLLEEGQEPSGSGSRCSTRSQINTQQPVVKMFTPRDSHRHLLRSEVAMCVLNYELPNIH